MASLTQWTWVWVNSGSWWWTGRPGVLQFMGSQRVGHDWATQLNWTEGIGRCVILPCLIRILYSNISIWGLFKTVQRSFLSIWKISKTSVPLLLAVHQQADQTVSYHSLIRLTRQPPFSGWFQGRALSQFCFAVLHCLKLKSNKASSLGPTSFALGHYCSFCFWWHWCTHSILSSCVWDHCDLCVFVFLPLSFDFVLLSFTAFNCICLLLQKRISPFIYSFLA